jgi:cyclophilin family peptidyl-prolyl cis-trans isomerase
VYPRRRASTNAEPAARSAGGAEASAEATAPAQAPGDDDRRRAHRRARRRRPDLLGVRRGRRRGDGGHALAGREPEPGPDEVACGAEVPKGALRPKPQFNEPAQVLEEGAAYTATFQTSCGDIVVELLVDRAPETVNSFVFLAQEGYFDGTRIHRLDTSLDVIQGGDPVGTGTSGPGYTIPDELKGGEAYGPGVFAMANSGTPDSGGSQFFLITGNNGHRLDANPAYTIFGNVIDGLAIAREIQGLPIQDPDAAAAGDISGQQPAQAVYIEKVIISVEK